MALWGFGRAELRTIRGTEICLPRFTPEKAMFHSRRPHLKIMSFVSLPTWVSNQSLDSFPNQPSSSPAIEGGCKPVALLISVCVLYI